MPPLDAFHTSTVVTRGIDVLSSDAETDASSVPFEPTDGG
jgi:hypothetical protein